MRQILKERFGHVIVPFAGWRILLDDNDFSIYLSISILKKQGRKKEKNMIYLWSSIKVINTSLIS